MFISRAQGRSASGAMGLIAAGEKKKLHAQEMGRAGGRRGRERGMGEGRGGEGRPGKGEMGNGVER
jgi:hypothetical protein